MDWFTQGLIPYAIVRLATKDRRMAIAAAVGGFAPDLDFFLTWLTLVHPSLFAFTHRGLSHTLWGAPLFGLALWYLLTRPRIKDRWDWSRDLAFDRHHIGPVVAGALIHLPLDAMTISGIPLLWPLTPARFHLDAFFFIIPTLAVASLVTWIHILRGRATERTVRTGLLAVLVLLVLSAAVRTAALPPQDPDDVRVPGPLDWQWHTARVESDGVRVESWSFGRLVATGFYAEPNRTQAASAIQACRALPEWNAFQWDLWGPTFTQANTTDDGGWNITIHDAIRYHQNATGAFEFFTPPDRDEAGRDAFECRVAADGTAERLD